MQGMMSTLMMACSNYTQTANPTSLMIVFSAALSADAVSRELIANSGVCAITASIPTLTKILAEAAAIEAGKGGISCPICPKSGMNSDSLWLHMPLAHILHHNVRRVCPVCNKNSSNIQVHVHDEHPPESHAVPDESKVWKCVWRYGDDVMYILFELCSFAVASVGNILHSSLTDISDPHYY